MDDVQPGRMKRPRPRRRFSPRRRRHAILCFHDVRDGGWLRAFLSELSSRAPVVSLGALVQELAHSPSPEPCVAATFDDGYKSIRTVVEPVCSSLDLPFTTFVCGEVMRGGPAPWYERVGLLVQEFGAGWAAKYWGLGEASGGALMSALKEAPKSVVLKGLAEAERDAGIDARALCARFMTEEDLAAVARNPLATVGSHTYSHPILANLEPPEQRSEIRQGLEALRDVCGSAVEFFAYPNGKPEDFDDAVVKALQDAGLRAAVTTVQRPLRAADDLMRLPRLGVTEGDTVAKLELKWALPWLSVGETREAIWRRRRRGHWTGRA